MTVRDPVSTGRKPVIVDGAILCTAVSQEVADAIQRVAESTHEHLIEALAPFGLHPNDILKPEFKRVIYRDELMSTDEGVTP